MDVKVDGRALRRQVYRMFNDIDGAGAEVAQEWANVVQAYAQELAPVDTGFLRDHIGQKVSRTAMAAQVGVFDKRGFYGVFPEKGTESITAEPYIEPAAELGDAQIEEITRRAIDRWLPE
ncbi:HK97-gp10 family putative phage morphogenesis protein [Herbidospora mongoliensis]|uniref:HK97-gp10 family putative phage morphogenesis protein n=1 Tax=Herbidospora mongoliensis TaxID=688067 RepID=UPI00082D6929|nr:HK97-gp10 family putative phage morphogenesis protein [Herbidospora mongoliensis]